MAENPRFNNSGMFTGVNSDNYSDITPDSTSEVLATQGNVINSIKVFWNKLRAKLAYAISRPNTTDAVGGHYQPVYIDEHGVVQVCAPETINATIKNGSSIDIGNIPVHPGKTICVRLSGSFGGSATALKIGNTSVIYPSGASVYPANVNIDGIYLFTYMAGAGSTKWVLISSMNVADGTNNGLMTAAEHNKLAGIAEHANNFTYTLPTANASNLGGVKSSNNNTNDNAQKVYHVGVDEDGIMTVNVPWQNTHGTAYLRAGTKDTNANNSAGDGATYLKIVDDGAISSQVLIKGSNGAKVTSDANGITIEGPGTIPSYKKLGSDTNIAAGESCVVNGPNARFTDKYFLNAKGGWTQPTVTASMGRMSVSISNGALDMGSNLNATLHVTYNGSPIQFAFINNSYKVSNSEGALSISGVKASSAITNETTAVIVPMDNLSLKPQVLHFISKDSVELLD